MDEIMGYTKARLLAKRDPPSLGEVRLTPPGSKMWDLKAKFG